MTNQSKNKGLIKNFSLNLNDRLSNAKNNNDISLIKNSENDSTSSLENFNVPTFSLNSMVYLQNQLGGHSALIKGKSGKYATIIKPLTNDREGIFYKKIKHTPLYQCLPKFYGMKREENNYYNHDSNADYPEQKKFKVNYWLILQDLTYDMTSPCIADLKIGTRTCEINIPKSKQEKRYNSSIGTTTLTHGVRCIDICMRKNNQIVQRWNRKVGRKMSWNDLQKALECFLVSKKRITQFNEQLKILRTKLVETYQILPNLRLYSASVLLVYDGDIENGNLTVKLIDFGHGYIDLTAEGGNINDHSCDDNAILGIDNLLLFADSLLNNVQ